MVVVARNDVHRKERQRQGSNTMDDKSTITLNKDGLEKILYEFGVLENEMANFLLIIDALREHFEQEMLNDNYAVLSLVKNQLMMFHDKLYKLLGNTDDLMLNRRTDELLLDERSEREEGS